MARRVVVTEHDTLSSLLVVLHEEGDIDEHELCLLLMALKDDAVNSLLPPLQFIGRRLCIDSLDEEMCLRRYRLGRSSIFKLHEALQMPQSSSQYNHPTQDEEVKPNAILLAESQCHRILHDDGPLGQNWRSKSFRLGHLSWFGLSVQNLCLGLEVLELVFSGKAADRK